MADGIHDQQWLTHLELPEPSKTGLDGGDSAHPTIGVHVSGAFTMQQNEPLSRAICDNPSAIGIQRHCLGWRREMHECQHPAYPKAFTSRSPNVLFLVPVSRFGIKTTAASSRFANRPIPSRVISTNSTWTAASNHTGRSVYFFSPIMKNLKQTANIHRQDTSLKPQAKLCTMRATASRTS